MRIEADPALVVVDRAHPSGQTRKATRFDRFTALVVLTVFGLTWPVLDLLGRNAEFFLARRSPKGEILSLALVLTLAIPALVATMGSLPGRVGYWVGLVLVTLTAATLARLYLGRLGIPWWVAQGVALVGGGLATWAFSRFASVRQTLRLLLPAPLIVLAVFLFAMPVGDVLREPSTVTGSLVTVGNPMPIVMLVFDEFPVASLIDPAGALRADRFPNFARLAVEGIWYRNAVTVEQQTEHSVPAMLTGSVPDQSLIPVAGQYPFNLFTALHSVYDLHVYEAVTQLCPRALCEGLASSVTSLSRDVAVVAGHVLLPEPLSEQLPEIERSWGDFKAVARDFDARAEFSDLLSAGQRTPIDRFLDDIRTTDTDRPPLFYLHALVPHHPWQFLPDGRSYPLIVGLNPASESGGWIDDEFLVAQAMQRHLLQVGYVDHVLGEVLAALEVAGIYEETLLVVVADHGISIKPGVAHQRRITESTVGEIAAIPLFVKLPHPGTGAIDDRRALTIDILPTIADVIQADIPDDVEGVSLLGPAPDRSETTTVGPGGGVTYDVDGDEKLAVARRLEELFPGGDPWALRPRGSPDLVGAAVDAAGPEPAFTWRLTKPGLYDDVDLSGDVIPVRVGGTLNGDVDGSEVLAVSVNGVIGAVTRSYVFAGEVSFLAMVPPALFVDGANTIELIHLTAGGEPLLVAGDDVGGSA